MRFIHASDLHIDSPLRGLDRYEGAPVARLRTATRAALERLVDMAIAERVDFVLFGGDIYDRDWQDFHTGLFFREQMVRLGRAGIRVFIVQGNHDAQGVITRQLILPPNVTVFSRRTAQTVQIDELSLAIHGRSFLDRAVDEDLLPSYPAPVCLRLWCEDAKNASKAEAIGLVTSIRNASNRRRPDIRLAASLATSVTEYQEV